MRARNLKPGFFKNELLGSVEPLIGTLFQGTWCSADREGRLEDRPLRLCAEIFPYRRAVTERKVDGWLDWLHEHEFIIRYAVEGIRYIQIVEFLKHQKPHRNEQQSKIPPPTQIQQLSLLEARPSDDHGNPKDLSRPASSLNPHSLNPHSLISRAPRHGPAIAGPDAGDLPEGLDREAWDRWVAYRREIRKPLKAASIPSAQKKLLAFGGDQAAVVEQSIANGWQGLFELKDARSKPNGKHVSPLSADQLEECERRQITPDQLRKELARAGK